MKKGKSFWLVEEVLDASSPFHACPSMHTAVLPNSLLAMSLNLWPPTEAAFLKAKVEERVRNGLRDGSISGTRTDQRGVTRKRSEHGT